MHSLAPLYGLFQTLFPGDFPRSAARGLTVGFPKLRAIEPLRYKDDQLELNTEVRILLYYVVYVV